MPVAFTDEFKEVRTQQVELDMRLQEWREGRARGDSARMDKLIDLLAEENIRLKAANDAAREQLAEYEKVKDAIRVIIDKGF